MIDVQVEKRFHGDRHFHLSVRFSLEGGKILALFGPSGAGKTTLLRLIAGFIKPDAGLISVHDSIWYSDDGKVNTRVMHRDLGYVFQEDSLFPHMTVRENLAFAGGKEYASHLEQLIGLFELGEFIDQRPDRLSGGQKKRAEIARALMRRPSVLLLDEPLTALDMELREQILTYLPALKREGLTILYVSHELSEVARIADEMIIMFEGRLLRHETTVQTLFRKEMSGKFQLTGRVIFLEKMDVLHVAAVQIGNQMTRIVLDPETAATLKSGDHVMIASKAFNPMVRKIQV